MGLVYLSAFAPDGGESVDDLGKGVPPLPWASKLVVDAGGFAWLPPDVLAKYMAPDLPAAPFRWVPYADAIILALAHAVAKAANRDHNEP